ncbi:MAG: DUF4337 family protein [Bacteroidota bacterium]|jgi:hypothetical protein|nr:DUF4337 family protein [Flammeovirgaceae bacterium]MCZ8069683.1 DUF4337 family protein [Cytophagales bacterium]
MIELDGNLGADGRPHNAEMRIAYMIAFFAAALSIIEIGANNYRDREIVSVNKKMTEYSLYHSKILNETLMRGERDLLDDLVRAGAIIPKDTLIIHERLGKFDMELDLIRRQQSELMNGSASIETARWAMPDINNQLGKIKGLRQWEYEVAALDVAGDKFDLACLLLELSLVMGAMGFIVRLQQGRNLFRWLMAIFGALGIGFGMLAYYQAVTL